MQQLLKDLLTAYKFGVKTLYYQNTRDGAEDAQDDSVPSIRTMAAKAAHVNLILRCRMQRERLIRPTARICRPDKTRQRRIRHRMRRKMPYPALNSQQDTLMAYTTFSQTKNDQLKEPMFFGQPVNVARYDQQKYDIFEKLIEKQLSFFWRPEEVDVSRDRIDYQALPEHEKHIFISNLKYQTLLDSIQGRSPNVALLPLISSRNWRPGSKPGRSQKRFIPVPILISFVISLTIRLLCLTISSPTSRSRNVRKGSPAITMS